MKRINLDETDSTNNYLRQNKEKWSNESIVVTADFQTAGRGQATNQWEAERGQNLLFSILIHPHHIEACEQFCISEATDDTDYFLTVLRYIYAIRADNVYKNGKVVNRKKEMAASKFTSAISLKNHILFRE